MNNDKSEMTVTDIININLKKIGLVRTKELMLNHIACRVLMDSKQRNEMESAIDKQFNQGINPKS